MWNDESSLVRTSGRRIGRDEEASNSKVLYFLRIPMCIGGGCVVTVLSLTRGRPVEVSDMITTILIRLKEPRGDNMPLGVADEPVVTPLHERCPVIVKRLTDDAHGDMSRGENKAKVQQVSALGRKTVAEVKGGTCNQGASSRSTKCRCIGTDLVQKHENQGELEKKSVHRGRLLPTRKGVRDVRISQISLEDAPRTEIPRLLINRKEVVQWNNNTAT